MEDRYQVEATRETPALDFDRSTGIFTIAGRSLPENSFEFYNPAVQWLKSYIQGPNKETNLVVYLEYLNSGSLKQLFRIMYLLEDLIELGSNATITWKYEKEDQLMLEKGKEFQQFLIIPIALEEI